jgi:hypothetical protein
MRAAWLVAATAVGVVVSGCASVPDDRPDDLPEGKAAVSEEQAAAALGRYDEIANTARAEGDEEALEAVESGVLLETSMTSYVLAEARDDEPENSFRHTDVRGYSPRFTEYPMWFVSASTIDNDPGRVAVQVLTRESSSSEWIVEQAAGLGSVELPEIAATDGEFVEPGEAEMTRVPEVLDQVANYLSGADAEDGVDLSGLDNYREWVTERTINEEQVTSPSVSCERDERAELRVVPTEDGVLAVVTMSCTIEQSIEETIDATMSLGGDLAALAPEEGRRVEFRSSHPVVVSLPDAGAPEVFSGGWRWAEVTMHDE